MPLKDGIYVISNVKQRNSVFLENPDDETPLRAHYRQDSPGQRWQVIDRGNGQHSIQNVGFQRYANSGTLSGLDAFVEGRDREQLWYVQERSKGKYTIATTDSGNFWMLPDNQINTPVGLLDKPTDQRCWWIFTNTETEAPADDGLTDEVVLFELKPLPILPFSPLRIDFVIIQQISDDSVSNALRSIGEICGSLVSSTAQPDNLRANIIEFKPFESTIFFRRFTGLLTVEDLCKIEGLDISWNKCSSSSLPEMAIRGLRTDATKVAFLSLDITLLQQSSQAIIKLINRLIKQNITLVLTPIRPTFYKTSVFQELRNISSESRLFEQMDEFSDYVANYDEAVALPRLIEYPELREVTHEVMPRIMGMLINEDHDTRSSAVTALSRLAEHGLYEAEAMPRDSFGRTALSWAAGSGYEEVVRLLLDLEGDINAKDNEGRTPLSWAAENGHNAVVCLLLDRKDVDVNAKDNRGDTPLCWAAFKGQDGVVRMLLAHKGADVDAKGAALLSAATGGHHAVVRLLLTHNGVDVNAKDNTGQTPLLWAAKNGHDAVISLLLEQEGINVNAKDRNADTPLSNAAWKGNDGAVRLLLAHKGVDVNVKNNSDRTPLWVAAAVGREEVVKLLLVQNGVDVNAKDNHGYTPLLLAALRGKNGVVRLLLAQKGVDVDAKDDNGRTVLACAVEYGHREVVQLLKSRVGQGPASTTRPKRRR